MFYFLIFIAFLFCLTLIPVRILLQLEPFNFQISYCGIQFIYLKKQIRFFFLSIQLKEKKTAAKTTISNRKKQSTQKISKKKLQVKTLFRFYKNYKQLDNKIKIKMKKVIKKFFMALFQTVQLERSLCILGLSNPMWQGVYTGICPLLKNQKYQFKSNFIQRKKIELLFKISIYKIIFALFYLILFFPWIQFYKKIIQNHNVICNN